MNAISMKSWLRRRGGPGALAALISGCALGCTPAVNLGDLPASSSGGASSGNGSSTWDPSSGMACGVVTTLANNLNYPASMTISGDTLFFVTNFPQGMQINAGAVLYRVPVAGGDYTTLSGDEPHPHGVAADATSVYWTSEDKVKKMPAEGGPSTVIAAGQAEPGGLVVDASSVYWVNRLDGKVMKAPLAGGAAVTLFSPDAADPVGAFNLAVDAENVYWSATGTLAASGVVMKVPLVGGAATTLATGVNGAGAVAIDAVNVYWTDSGVVDADLVQGPGAVMKRSLDGTGAPVTIATRLYPSALALDPTHVYWGGGAQDPLYKEPDRRAAVSQVSSVGGTPESIFTSVIAESGLVACPGGVCWTDAAAGTVMRFVACAP